MPSGLGTCRVFPIDCRVPLRTWRKDPTMNARTTVAAAEEQSVPKMKMTTDIPPQITTPDSVETRLGTLKFFDGFPDDATVEKVMDNLDFSRGVQAFVSGLPGSSLVGMRKPAVTEFGPISI